MDGNIEWHMNALKSPTLELQKCVFLRRDERLISVQESSRSARIHNFKIDLYKVHNDSLARDMGVYL